MKLLQIIYFFVVGVPSFMLAYAIIELVDLVKKFISTLTR